VKLGKKKQLAIVHFTAAIYYPIQPVKNLLRKATDNSKIMFNKYLIHNTHNSALFTLRT